MFFFCSSLLLIILTFGIILFCHFYSALPGAKEEGEERRGEGTGVYQTFVFHASISMRFLLLWRSIADLGEGRESVVFLPGTIHSFSMVVWFCFVLFVPRRGSLSDGPFFHVLSCLVC